MKENYFNESLEKFHNLPEEIQEQIGGFDACLKIKKIEETYNISLGFVVILVAIGELVIDDLPEYFKLKYGVSDEIGQKIADELEVEIFEPVVDLILEVGEIDDVLSDSGIVKDNALLKMSLPQRKEFILNTFSKDILAVIQSDNTKIKDFNIALFKTFNEDEDLEDKVESLLYVNQERLSNKPIILDKQLVSPTIANWLKDFIKRYGSDLFNEVTLAEYLSQSENIRNITAKEKELVRKVLKLYRNLVFFPESMDGVLLDNWEIFPIEQPDISFKPEIVSAESKPPIVSERQKTIFDLQKNLTKYASNSLEYKALQQEINRLSRK